MLYTRPEGYLLTFTCYGTWPHGDERGSVDKDHNVYGWPRLESNPERVETMRRNLKYPPMDLTPEMCATVDAAIRETATYRKWLLAAVNVRTNHVHIVAHAPVSPEKMLNDFKAYATRGLRRAGLVAADRPVWCDGGSTVYLWKPLHVGGAIHYVLHRQGDNLFDRDQPSSDEGEPRL